MTGPDSTAEESSTAAMLHRLGTSFWISQSLYVMAKLGVADQLSRGPGNVHDVALAVGADPSALYRVMRALASVGVFTETAPHQFALTPMGKYLRTDVAGSLRAQFLTINELDWLPWSHLLHSVQTGGTAFNRQHDVGGGRGALMTAILQANPGAQGIVFDRPSVVQGAEEAIAAAGLSERCDTIGGDFFDAVPSGGDVYILASIIHDWDDERSVAILRTCRRGMRPESRLLLIEMVIPEGDVPSYGKFLDVEMLVLAGGRERTSHEYAALLANAGFRPTRIIPTHTSASIIEATAD